MNRADYLIAYDISDPRRLGRVCRYLKRVGVHIQYSVFLARLTRPGLRTVESVLLDLIDEAADDVRIYRLPPGPRHWSWLGRDPLPSEILLVEPGHPLIPEARTAILQRRRRRTPGCS